MRELADVLLQKNPVALKACKGHTEALLMGAAAQKYQLFLCVQDLTCIGFSFLHSASIAARIPTIAAIEGNGRQYCPAGNRGWDERFHTGTGFPGDFYLNYHLYRDVFPVMALGRALSP